MKYQELSLLLRLIIFAAAWIVIACFGKLSAIAYNNRGVVFAPLVTLPKSLKIIFYGWLPGYTFSLPCMFIQLGNYALFLIYPLGDLFGFTGGLPDELPSYVLMIAFNMWLLCTIIYTGIYRLKAAASRMKERATNKKANRYGKVKRNKKRM